MSISCDPHHYSIL